MCRKEALVTGEVYHIYNKSIADFVVFNSEFEFLRMRDAIRYYQKDSTLFSFSQFIKQEINEKPKFSLDENQEKLIHIIAYCIMPTHLHLILKQLKQNGISTFMGRILNSYSKYFNIKHKRKGPLWEGRFSNVLVRTDDQLLLLTRYIHLNPVTAYLVNKPEDWLASSYLEYLLEVKETDKICKYDNILNIEPISYRKFVEDGISYQRELSAIKRLLLG